MQTYLGTDPRYKQRKFIFYIFDTLQEQKEFVKNKKDEGKLILEFDFDEFNPITDIMEQVPNGNIHKSKKKWLKNYNITEKPKQEFKKLEQIVLF